MAHKYTKEYYEALLFATNTYIKLHDLDTIDFDIFIGNVVIRHKDKNGKNHIDDLIFNQDFLRQLPIENEWEYLLEVYRAVKKDALITMDEFSQSLSEDPMSKIIAFAKAETRQCFEAYYKSHKTLHKEKESNEMNTDTGQFIIDEETEKALLDTKSDFIKKFAPLVLAKGEEMPENSVPVERLPDPKCPKCFGLGHKQRSLATQKFHPCPCVL